MDVSEIRSAFLQFFADREHAVVPSAAIVPDNDPTLFFVNAGMVQFKDVFTGEDVRDYSRATSVQKCMRVSGKHNDLDNVGFTARHHTLFEMLGNFSFGDYFKEEAIEAAWTFLTKTMGLPEERLLITVFDDDDEAAAIWERIGVPPERIGRCGVKDNFWSMGPTGPCGPCTEIHWDLQSDFVPDNEPDPWGFGEDAGRFMEIWNLVFMQYERYEEDGQIKQRDLPRPSVDTGMGLERLAAIKQGKKTNWDIDLLRSIIDRAGEIAGRAYGEDQSIDVALRVIADHSRAAAFLVGDGVMPDNEGRGYVLRRIMRRAIRYGVKAGIDQPFLHRTADRVIDLMGAAYPALVDRREFILKVVANEERAFRATLDRGLELLDAEFNELVGVKEPVLSGDVVFKLHDTFGFPPDLTEIIAAEKDVPVDRERYAVLMEEQRDRGRQNWKGSGEEAIGDVYRELQQREDSVFTGYNATQGRSLVEVLLVDGASASEATAGTQAEVVLKETPFYATSGGQVGDTGWITDDGLKVRVTGTTKPAGKTFVHAVEVLEGTLRVGDFVDAAIDVERRDDIRRNHTATHLLHAALRDVLGTHVQQKGSEVKPDELRFDFSHFDPVSDEELARVEDLVNGQILADTHAVVAEMSMDEAVGKGAMALFGEKYGDRVRVVEIPGFSTELCGGTHCDSTGQIGLLKIVSEGGIAAGVRRIVALTGRGALAWVREADRRERDLRQLLRTRPEETVDKVGKLLEDRRDLQRQIEQLKQQLVTGGASSGPQAVDVAGVALLATVLDGVGGKELRGHADALLDKIGPGVVVLGATDAKGKASLLVKVSSELSGRLPANDLIRELASLAGGSGGGRAEMAQGRAEPGRLAAAIEQAPKLVEAALG
jgi:alanyl-tRNA synthetase